MSEAQSPSYEHARERFRAYPLDGALLYFQPSSGVTLRVRGVATGALTRRAPRVVMFGITNLCNLTCDFCSRDSTRDSEWTVDTAAQVLRGLARAGSLEVAFGGGEPFAFRGFAELISELHATTPLALNVTTNGTLLSPDRFAAFQGKLGQVRLSIYDDQRWVRAARTLNDAGQIWGANLLVDERRLPQLPGLFARLAALGCRDVAVLKYVGGDPSLQLGAAGRERLAEYIRDAPLGCRISVCFGSDLDVPRLFDGLDARGDCGAGYDFVTLTPDRRVQSCSFQSESIAIESARDVLQVWRQRQTELQRASNRVGCARRVLPRSRGAKSEEPQLAVWRSFSGNNSGECILVGKFETSELARRFVDELRATWAPDEDYPEAWRELFAQENVALHGPRDDGELFGRCPSSLVALGRSVLARGYDADDAFPELRALTWKRAGYVAPGGIHLHDSPSLLAAIRCSDVDDARWLETQQVGHARYLHGEILFIHVPAATRGDDHPLEAYAGALSALAADRPLAAELLSQAWDETRFLAAKKQLGAPLASRPRLSVDFYGPDAVACAQRYAAQIGAEASAYGRYVLIEGLTRRKRPAVLALRQGGYVKALDGAELAIHAQFWLLDPPRTKGREAEKRSLDLAALRGRLSASFGKAIDVDAGPSWRGGGKVHIVSSEPATVLSNLSETAKDIDAQLSLRLREIDPMPHILRRLLSDLE